jgi:hypothetical protein
MDFNFQYRITYENGQFNDRPHEMTVQITMDEYKKIVLGVLEGRRIEEIDNISEAVEKMTEIVRYIDSWINMDGSQRTTPLKKARSISELEFFLPMTEYERLKNMQNPKEVFERHEEHMTIYRNDGSSVMIRYEYGQVKVTDSRNPCLCKTREADYFISTIV